MTLKILRTGDSRSAFNQRKADDILKTFGPPMTLLSSSAKTDKSEQLGIYTRVLYLTPGVFCPSATDSCLEACLGHTSGRMQLPTSTKARDQRAALYLANKDNFLRRLHAELTLFEALAETIGVKPAVRLNGTSDLYWERLHPDVFSKHPSIIFYDYTKIKERMRLFLSGNWPVNYHLTFSCDHKTNGFARNVLSDGGTVANVFWPKLPTTWLGFPVLNGDKNDARFLDDKGSVVGLLAKGFARVSLDGFVTRLCPTCPTGHLQLKTLVEDTHRHTLHHCSHCGYKLSARHKLAA